jgi:ribosome biogenesis GTPase
MDTHDTLLGKSTIEVLNAKKQEFELSGFVIGRVTAEHKERYMVMTAQGEAEAEITGHIRFTARDRIDFPAVGDWVAMEFFDNAWGIIHHILPRYSLIERQGVGKAGERQVIAANIDVAFIVQAIDRDFNINRLERYLTICYSANVTPVILISKTDLKSEAEISTFISSIGERIKDVKVIAFSNLDHTGYDTINSMMEAGKTYCLLGSSGVGKSTLLNQLCGHEQMKTGSISQSTNKGKHVTSHRELFALANGAFLIDNPGMREVGIADLSNGLDQTFDLIMALAEGCRYSDCTHTTEEGCSVIEAVEDGRLNRQSYENYLRMEREKAHFESTLVERRRKDKAFGKMLKGYKKEVKKGK